MRFSTLALLFAAVPAFAQSTATYRVTLDATWSASTHPAGFPGDPHFSPLVGAAHDASASLWAPGGIATNGIEQMAERGTTAELVGEINVLRSAANVSAPIVGPGVGTSPGSATLTVTLDEATPLLSLVSMIAPSPDWFVGVHGLDLRAGGAWAEALDVPLVVYDAGTDSGTGYTSPNADTVPKAPISQITGAPFLVGGEVLPVGTLRLERVSVTAGEGTPETASFELSAPVPNPVRASSAMTLRFDQAQTVDVRVLDSLGRTVAILADGPQAAGPLTVRVSSERLAAGVYTVVARGAQTLVSRRLVVVR